MIQNGARRADERLVRTGAAAPPMLCRPQLACPIDALAFGGALPTHRPGS